jgi:hypothetical protein
MIPIVDPKKNYWVIRADGGFHFNTFIKNGFVALSHIDDLEITSNHLSTEILNNVAIALPNERGSSRHRQVYRFIDKINLNDWVITIGKRDIAIGIVKSHAFLDGSGFDNKKYLLGLRRNIEWTTTINRNDIPYDLQVGLKCNQSLFSITKYHESIYHTLFPFFIKGPKVHTSLKIKAQTHIRTKDVIQLFELIDKIDEFCQKTLNKDKKSITPSFVKAQFKSPGDIWAIYNDIKTNVPTEVFYFIGIYIAIFGNSKLGFDGIIDKENKQKLIDFCKTQLKNRKIKKSLENLKIEMPESEIYAKLPDSEKLKIEPILINNDTEKRL